METFNIQTAVAYNTKAKPYLQNNIQQINSILQTSAPIESTEFAQAVYGWQQQNNFSGRYLDGKLGPITLHKMVELNPSLIQNYSPEEFYTNMRGNKVGQKTLSLYPLLNNIATNNNIPLNMLVGWVQVESAGNNADLTTAAKFKEVGLFQISEMEAQRLGIDLDSIRGNEPEKIQASLNAGVALINMRKQDVMDIVQTYPGVASQSISSNPDIFWRLVFFTFSAGEGTTQECIILANKYNFAINDWTSFTKFVMQHARELKRGYFASKWALHTARAFAIGNAAVNQQKVATLIRKRIYKVNSRARKIILAQVLGVK